MHKRKRRKGFTLVEVVIVIAIVAILAAAIFLGASTVIASAQERTVVSNLHEYDVALTNFMGRNQQGSSLPASATRADAAALAEEINTYLPVDLQIDVNTIVSSSGNIRNITGNHLVFQTAKEDPWGNPYFVIFDFEERNSGRSEYYITVISAGSNASLDIGGYLDGDDIFLLAQCSNKDVLTKTYKMSEDTADLTGTSLVAMATPLSTIEGSNPAPRNMGDTIEVSGGNGSGTGSGNASGGGGTSGGGESGSHAHAYTVIVSETAATCTTAGKKTLQCSCGVTKDFNVSAKGHTYGAAVETVAPTCYKAGETTLSCIRCSYSVTAPVAATGDHVFSEWVLQAEATRFSNGIEVRSCLNEGCPTEETNMLPMITLTGLTITTQPTTTKYVEGDAFDPTGMTVTASFSDNTTDGTIVYSILDGQSLTLGQTEVTISYTENGVTKNAAVAIQVEKGTPMLAANSTWFSQGNPTYNGSSITRASIQEITIVDEIADYAMPTGVSILDQWDASIYSTGADDNKGPVTAYVLSDYSLVVAGNGTDKVYANKDSSYAFASFTGLTAIHNANLLDTSNATTFERMFQASSKLESVDVGNWDTSEVTTLKAMFQGAKSINNLAVSNWETGKVTDMCAFLNMPDETYYNTSLTELDISNWDVSKVTTMRNLFFGCTALESLDVSNWDVSKVTDLRGSFTHTNIKTLAVGDWITSSCTDMEYMFGRCLSLESLDVSNWNVGNVTTMRSMFNGCNSLESLDVSNWDVSKVTTMADMFSMGTGNSEDLYERASALTNLDVSNWDTSSLTDVSFMFWGADKLGSIDVSNWDVSKVTTFNHMTAHSYLTLEGVDNWVVTDACTNMNAMFHSVNNTSLDVSKYDTSNVQFFDQMFENSQYLTEIIGLENFDTSNGLGFSDMFSACYSLKELDLSSFDTSKATDGVTCSENEGVTATMYNMFGSCRSLEKITLGENFTFKGDGTTTNTANYAVLPTPSSTYIEGATGNWYRVTDGVEFAPADVPSNEAATYVAVPAPTLAANSTWFSQGSPTYNGSDITRASIQEITIVDEIADYAMPTGVSILDQWDASIYSTGADDNEGPVTAYVLSDYSLVIAGNGADKVYANSDSSYAFSNSTAASAFINAKAINNLDLLNTTNTTNMKGMFRYLPYVETLDVGNWNTGNVSNMYTIFAGNNTYPMGLTSLNVSNWNTENVKDMAGMFQCCYSLNNIDVSNWDVSKVTTFRYMFYNCYVINGSITICVG